jgi:hypothetical protein
MRIPIIGASINRVAQAVAAGWNVEHGPDGRHVWKVVSPAFSAARFWGDGGVTWTVQASDRLHEWYARLGDIVLYTLVVYLSSTSGTAPTVLRVTLPDNLVIGPRTTVGIASYAIDNATVVPSRLVVPAGRTYIDIYKTDGTTWSAASSNATSIFFQIFFEVQ